MKLVFHGGLCCGIKHIYGFRGKPDGIAPALKKIKLPKTPWGTEQYERRHDATATPTRSDFSFFIDAAPKETYEQRLDRLLKFCDDKRPNGIIEVVLVDTTYYYYSGNQYTDWKPVLEKKGFKEVSSCRNSNSDHRIHVFHRCKDKT